MLYNKINQGETLMDFHHLITLEEIENIFHKKKNKRKIISLSILKYLALFSILTVIIFFSFNYRAYFKKTQYVSNPDQFNQLLKIPKPTNPTNSKLSQLVLPTLYPTNLTDNTLYIPKISVKAPVIWNVKEPDILEQLKNGVAHYDTTAMPGDEGKVFVTGHSSNYWWIKSPYNEVFALLDKVEIGDNIYLTYQGREYIYQITNKQVVKPSEVNVMDPDPQPTISLMTCVPVGTNLNRLIVTAKQISPKINQEAELVLPSTLLPTN